MEEAVAHMLRSISRRHFARMLAGMGTALPLLDSLDARAQNAGAGPKRLILVYNPNGTIPEAFWPAAGATETAARAQERHGLEQIGLPRAVGARQH